MRIHSSFLLRGLCGVVFSCMLQLSQGQNLPDAMRFDEANHRLITDGQATDGLYDESQLRVFQLWFSQPNYWQLLTSNYTTKLDLPATLIVGTDTFLNVGVRFKGQTSYSMIGSSQKKSFNITMDYADPEQHLMGYQTLNLNNCFEDASFMREVSYLHQIRKHVPAAKAAYVLLYINGAYWGVYPNVQQLNRDYIKEWFFNNDGTLWRADRPSGSPGGPGGGGPGWGDGTAALNYLGADTTTYQQYYTLKSTDDATPWEELVRVCDKLNNTPQAQLEDTISRYLDLDRTLWFLASEIAFSDDDSYIYKGKMDYYIYYDPETGFLTPLEFDGNSVMKSNTVNWGVFYNETKVNYPLLNKLLAVPAIRQRYLAHMRTLVQDELDSPTFNALIDQYDALINTSVQADTKKLYSYNEYNTQKTAIKTFVQNHRNTLLNHPEMAPLGPAITQTTLLNVNGLEWGSPSENEPATVRTSVSAANGIAAVWVWYSAGLSGRFSKLPMFDDGAHDDQAAGDGIYGATLPGFPTGTYVRFYVEAKAANAAGTVSFDPAGAEHDVYYYGVSAPWASERPVVINEIMASNTNTAADESGDFDDWIELHNLTDIPVNLSGYTLSDNPSNLAKWAFPDGVIIPESGYLIIWADEDGNQGPLHASFKLSASGESLLLADPLGRLVDTLNFGPQQPDLGYARVPNGTGQFVIQSATFGANNNTVGTGEAPMDLAWQVHPSPAAEWINVHLPEGLSCIISIYDPMGRLCERFQGEGSKSLNIKHLKPGWYTVKLETEGRVDAKVFVKQ